jgi:serine/threonine protein phosphatase PrpC
MQARSFFRSASRTHAGAVRATNEDALFVSDALGLWAVSDGMGGHAGGEIASATVVDTLRLAAGSPATSPLEHRARKALCEANAELCRRNEAAIPPSEMGATVALLGIEGARFFCLWAGDSRIYRIRGTEAAQLTRDHRYVQDLIDAGTLSESEAQQHPRRNVITRAVGITHDIAFDRCDGEVREGDIFLLATDGVSAICTAQDIAAAAQARTLEQAADDLAALCLKRAAPDNFAFVFVRTEAPRQID